MTVPCRKLELMVGAAACVGGLLLLAALGLNAAIAAFVDACVELQHAREAGDVINACEKSEATGGKGAAWYTMGGESDEESIPGESTLSQGGLDAGAGADAPPEDLYECNVDHVASQHAPAILELKASYL